MRLTNFKLSLCNKLKQISIYCLFSEFNFMGELTFEILLLILQLLLLGKVFICNPFIDSLSG